MWVIIKSSKKTEPNWSGKEWSSLPCKVYFSIEDAMDAITRYWFGDWHGGNPGGTIDNRQITFVPLTEEKGQKLIAAGKARL